MALPNPLGAAVALRPDDRLFIFSEYWRPVRSSRDGHWLAPVFDRSSEIFITHYDSKSKGRASTSSMKSIGSVPNA